MLVQQLIEFIAPAACLGCGREGALICDECRRDVSSSEERCYFCNKYTAGYHTCHDCWAEAPLVGVVPAALYTGPVRELVLGLKFKRSRASAQLAAELMAVALTRAGAPLADAVTAVPIAPARYRERGYNQAELMARALARRLGLPYRPLLGRVGADHQIGRGRHERLDQVRGRFYATRQLNDQRLLIVDDVLTTGATLAECSRVLAQAGAGAIWAATVARG
ncbi:MAG TPA: phosphoribosyltransferase family protein [Candidatus Saccharimonadia bacterium]|nr:phosphoribosyltransferase family protein [Candidatus Saccharimonadia bacterium]